jgi:uncharacterized protein (TIGR02145 family)
MFKILALLLLPVICLSQVNSNGGKPTGELLSNEISPNEMKRNASFNLEEIKVRWKKAALENCTGVPCVVTPPAPSFTCGTSNVSDIEGNSYETVLIGTQCWTKENLKVTKYNDFSDIPDATANTGGWGGLTTGARTDYTGATGIPSGQTYVSTYGYLYNWYAATDSRKICPIGWHVPIDTEWTTLIQFMVPSETLGGIGPQSLTAGGKMKSTSTLWFTSISPGTDDFGFSALPGGYRDKFTNNFNFIRESSLFWSATEATEISNSTAWYRNLPNSGSVVFRDNYFGHKSNGLSVRCLRD